MSDATPPAIRRPRVVLFRSTPIALDSRAKKWALSLARLGWDVVVLNPVPTGSAQPGEAWIGPVRVVTVEVGREHRNHLNHKRRSRRAVRFRIFTRLTSAEANALITGWRETSSSKQSRVERRLPVPLARACVRWRRLRARVTWERVQWLRRRAQAQQRLNARVDRGWVTWTRWIAGKTWFVTVEGRLPEVRDLTDAFGPLLLELAPDVLHAHHPLVLPVAVEVRDSMAKLGRRPGLLYDSREFFAGLPEGVVTDKRAHHALLRVEAGAIASVDDVVTVSPPIAEALRSRYSLKRQPAVVLNLPVGRALVPGDGRLREWIGVGPDDPLIIYSGGMSVARGLESLMVAMTHLPDVHLALVTVPFPHWMTHGLLELAGTAASRIHPLPPVSQEDLLGVLSGADIGVHPMPGGSPNHDMALPNKLFEYLHAGLTLCVSDARLLSGFVRDHALGSVFRAGDPVDLARAITEAFAHRAVSQPSPESLVREFSWQAQEPLIAGIYERWSGAVDLEERGRALAEPFPNLDVVLSDAVDDARASERAATSVWS